MVAWGRALCLAAVLSFAAGAEAQARWLRAETQRFVIYSDGDERTLREYAYLLEDFDTMLRLDHGVDQRTAPYRKLDIYLVRDREELGRATTLTSPSLAGFYSAGEDDIYAVAIRDRGGRGGERNDTLFHEYTHHFMAQYDPFPYPGWLVEGWAEYFATADIRDRRMRVGDFSKGRAYTLGHDWIPLEDVLRRRTHDINEEARGLYYAQAWLLTHYLYAHEDRREQLDTYKHELMAGEDPGKAMEIATGMSLKDLQYELQAYTRKGLLYRVHPITRLAEPPITLTTLSPAADDLLLENQKLMNWLGEKHRAPLLATIRERAARHPGDRLAQIVLARAEIFYGDRAAGEAVLAQRLAADSNDAEALRLMARSHLRGVEDTEDAELAARLLADAQGFLMRANKAERNNYQTYYYFVQTKLYEPGYPSDNTLKLLMDAHKVAPQVDTIAFRAAEALVLRNDFVRAEPMLQRLANNPHGGGLAAAARNMLSQMTSAAETP